MDVISIHQFIAKNKTKFQITYSKVFMNGDNGTKVPSNHGVLIKRIVFEKNWIIL